MNKRSITIIIADDDPEDRMLAEDALKGSRLVNDIRFVEDGEELLEYLQRRGKYSEPDSSPRPGLILLDLNMPRMDGREALEQIKRDPELRRIPVVVLPGAGSYVTYTNALFDRDAAGPIVYLPTYRVPALDRAATERYTALGFRVVPIDVSTVYTLNGSLGCLVNVMARR